TRLATIPRNASNTKMRMLDSGGAGIIADWFRSARHVARHRNLKPAIPPCSIITPNPKVSNRSLPSMARAEPRPRREPATPASGWLRDVLALALLGVVAAVCASLGMWQLD